MDKQTFTDYACIDVQGLLGALNGCQEISEQDLWKIDPNDEAAVRKVIREYIRPGFMKCKENSTKGLDAYNSYNRLKKGLRWLINLNDEKEFRWIFNVGQFCIEPAAGDYQRFFIWIWEELCGDEDWHIENMSRHVENDNPYESPN